MKFTKDGFKGVVLGGVYPTEFAKGEECPKELERAAAEQGFIRVAQKNHASKEADLLGDVGAVEEKIEEIVVDGGASEAEPVSAQAMDTTEVVEGA